MPHVIRIPADTSVAAIQSALAGVRAHDIGLAFPLGVPCISGTRDAMRGLFAHCAALAKDVVILGGDEHLRAAAVAAGFPAATSLAEWVATQPRLAAATAILPSAGDEWEYPPLSFVAVEQGADSERDPFDPFDEVPPNFVLELMAQGGAYGSPSEDDELSAGSSRTTEPSGDDSLLAAHERYEEHITRSIRHTGGLSLSRTTHPPLASFTSFSSATEENTGGDGTRSL